jgi:catechol 2,3-dioxygenase-like lactoylglutathione lyase family enzyme
MTSTDTPPIRISGVRTVAIPVRDQERALTFYRDTLGFELRMDTPMGPDQRWIEVAPVGSVTSIALVGAGTAPASGTDTGIRLTTDDAAASHAGLSAAGVDVDPEIIAFPVPMFTFRDPDGNTLVLVEQRSGR